MTDRELMQQALEALELYADYEGATPSADKAIAALRERLAQPEQDWDWRHPKAQALIGAKARLEIKLRLIEQLLEDPHFETTASDMEYWEPLHDKLQERLAQPEQKPVAWFDKEFNSVRWRANLRNCDLADQQPLYTTPPRREWVGLTEEEIALICGECAASAHRADDISYARAIEAKLREKNA